MNLLLYHKNYRYSKRNVQGFQLKSGPLTKPWIFHFRCYLCSSQFWCCVMCTMVVFRISEFVVNFDNSKHKLNVNQLLSFHTLQYFHIARVKGKCQGKTRKDGARSALFHCMCVVRLLLFVLFGCHLCCSMYCFCVNVYCHRVTTQVQLMNISSKSDRR
jgi:hypothetical protein